MKALASQIRATELEKRTAQDARVPRIALNGAWNEQGLSPASAIPVYDFGVSLDVPLYTGGRIRAQVAIEDIELKKLGQQQTDLRNQIAQEVKTATAQLDVGEERSRRRQSGRRSGARGSNAGARSVSGRCGEQHRSDNSTGRIGPRQRQSDRSLVSLQSGARGSGACHRTDGIVVREVSPVRRKWLLPRPEGSGFTEPRP